uniref:histidine--tRNA ligase n=1 Tax=Eutreptiella gymnastica TaxID=73025 RepID=A0A7S1J9P1_9EUGL
MGQLSRVPKSEVQFSHNQWPSRVAQAAVSRRGDARESSTGTNAFSTTSQAPTASTPIVAGTFILASAIVGALASVWSQRRSDRYIHDLAMVATSGRQSAAVVQDKSKKAQTKFDLQPPKGTRDFYPEDMRLQSWLFGHFRRVAAEFGFEEYDAPVLENEDLYIRKAGEEVSQQLYNFEDKGGRRVALRPEMTPSLARMVLAKRKQLPGVLKWYSLPQCWRYERMTRGRRREHYQWNMDIWGVEGVEAEGEALAAMVKVMSDMGLTSQDVGIKINSRKILTELMAAVGIPEEKFAPTCVLVDKLEKVPLDALSKDMEELGLAKETVASLLEAIQGATVESFEARLGADSPGVMDIKQIFAMAESYGYQDWLVFDASVVRGLAYYTGTVFEGFDRTGELRAICGGGRYDKLLETLGGEPMPAVGFGFGDAVIVELLKVKGLLPDTTTSNVQVVVFPMNGDLRGKALEVASALRNEGLRVDMVLETGKKTKWAFKYADRLAANCLVLLAPDEVERGEVVVKNLKVGEQSVVPISAVAGAVKVAIAGSG